MIYIYIYKEMKVQLVSHALELDSHFMPLSRMELLLLAYY